MIITSEMVISGFVSKVINDCGDILKNKIKDADKNRKSNEKNMETKIYQVIVDALNGFSYNEYKKEEKVYDAAESILKQFKDGRNDYKEAVRKGLKIVVSKVTDDICKSFLGVLCYEICRDENRDLAIEVIILQQEQTNGYIQEGFRRGDLKVEEINRKLDYLIKELINNKVYEEQYSREIHVKNRAEEYADRWKENVFLNDFNKRDENAGVNIKLSELYVENQLPHYIWRTNEKLQYDLKELLSEYIVDINDKKMLLILGQAGIGKSTLITWIMANLAKNNKQILVYQFAADLGSINWQNDGILEEIFITIGLEYNELEGKILILDGFDEIYVRGNRERILIKIDQELKRVSFLKGFSVIITCRENYVDKLELGVINYITLQAWDEEQIKSFCKRYKEEIIRKSSEIVVNKITEIRINIIIEKKDIIGIPLILYMILALNVDIERSSSDVDIYDQVFSLKRSGIYDRCYDVEHRINETEIKKHIHRISQKIAFWMFENNADKAIISQEKFKDICNNEMKESGKKGKDIQRDVLIGNYFKQIKHCEGVGTDELQFVHRSIYEYFVAVYFFEAIHSLNTKEKVAGKLGELLKEGRLSERVLEFIKYKFDNMQRHDLPDIIREVFNIMLRDGMTYYVKGKYKNIIVMEMNIFVNMLDIVRLWNYKLGELDNKILFYLQYNRLTKLDLRGVCLRGADLKEADLKGGDLKGADLRGADLRGADLRGADLRVADLGGVNLEGADLRGADLSVADLRRADLRKADLRGADLRGVDLSAADLEEANLGEAIFLVEADLDVTNLGGVIFDENQVNLFCKRCDLSGCKVCILETGENISYEEYCIRKERI